MLANSKISLDDYINAIRFCGCLESSQGNATDAYIKAFSHRNFVKDRMGLPVDSIEFKALASAASRYRKSPTVIKILAQSEVPLYLMFQGYRYKAVEVLADRMMNARLDRDKINAADKLLFHLKPPEEVKIELGLDDKANNIVEQYKEAIMKLTRSQKDLIAKGGDVKAIANAPIMEAEIVESSVEKANA